MSELFFIGNTLSIADGQGEPITDENNIGHINPYRYRGYRYDKETGLYYLQSRYYSAQWGRFINFDNYGGQVGDLLSHNGYMYCLNNPVNRIDEDGNASSLVGLGLLIGAIISWAGSQISPETITSIDIDLPTITKNKKKTQPSVQMKSKVTTTTNRFTKTKTAPKDKYNYWEANLVKGNVVTGKGISKKEANIRVDLGKNIMCRDQKHAFEIVKYRKNTFMEINKDQSPGLDYYPHYHINGNHGAPHIWFYPDV